MSLNSTIAELLLEKGRAQAQGAAGSGAAWGQGLSNIGQTVGNAINQATDPRLANERTIAAQNALRLKSEQDVQRGQQTVDSAMAGDQLPAGDAGPRQQSYLDKNGLFDVPKLNALLASSGSAHLAPELLKGAEAINDSITKHQDLEQKAAAGRTVIFGDMAHGALNLAKTGMSLPDAMDFVAQPGLATKRIEPQEYAQVRAKIAALPPDQQVAALTQFMDQAAQAGGGETLAKDAVKLDRYGRTVASNVVPEKPTEASLDADAQALMAKVNSGQQLSPTEQASLTAYQQRKNPPKGIEEEWLARDRRLAVAKNGGNPLSDEQQRTVDAASMQDFAKSKADPAMRDAALAQKNIALALAQAQLGMVPTKEQASSVAEDLVNHRISPDQLATLFSTRGKDGLAFKLAVTSEAKKLDPSFNFEEAQSNYNLSKSTGFQNTVRYMDSVQESMPRLNQTAAALGNGQYRTLNALENAAANQFNSTDLKKFKVDALLVGDEVAKILSGGGSGSATSDAKLKQATDIISTSDSVPAVAAAVNEIQTLIGFRRKALTRGTYMEGTNAVKPPPETPAASTAVNPFRK